MIVAYAKFRTTSRFVHPENMLAGTDQPTEIVTSRNVFVAEPNNLLGVALAILTSYPNFKVSNDVLQNAPSPM